MNVNEHGRQAKRQQLVSNNSQINQPENTSRELVVLPREKFLELEKRLKILTESK